MCFTGDASRTRELFQSASESGVDTTKLLDKFPAEYAARLASYTTQVNH